MTRGLKVRNCKECGKEFRSYNVNPMFCSNTCRGLHNRHAAPFEKIIELYEQGMSQTEVAKALGTSQKVIWTRMNENGYVARVAAKRNQIGENNDYWKGGRSTHSCGYIYVTCKGHPRALKLGSYVLEHILVVEEFIGRYLSEEEIVHHINGKKDDNRPENLYITNLSEHTNMHNDGTSHLLTSNLVSYRKAGVI